MNNEAFAIYDRTHITMDDQFSNKINKKETVILEIYQKHQKRLKSLPLIKNAEFASISSMSLNVSENYREKVLFWRSHVSPFSSDGSNDEDFLRGKLTTHHLNLSAPTPKALWSTSIIIPCIFHTFPTQWSTIRPFSLFSTRHFSKNSAIFVSNHRASSFRSSIQANLSLAVLFLLFVALVSFPTDAALGYLQSTSAVHAPKNFRAPPPSHLFSDSTHRHPTVSHFANLPSSVSFAFTSTIPLLTSKGHSFLRRPNVRHRRLQSGPDLQASESIHYEAMQQTQPSATTPTTLLNLEDDLHFSKQDLTGNLSMEITRHNHQIIKSYPIGYQNQLYCDQNFADLNKNKQMDSLPDDSIIQQRVIVESEQLELFLRLRPSGSISSSLMEKDHSDRLLDDFQFSTTPITPESDKINLQRRKVQCQEMLQSQLEKDLQTNQKIPKRPLFELSTSTFKVSCHVVHGPQLQCVLFAFNMHHFGSIFRNIKEPYCSFTFVRFNLIDSRCQLSLILKRIDPFKGTHPPNSTLRTSRNSKIPLPVTSSIWELLQDTPQIMYPFSDQNGTVYPTVLPLSLDMPVPSNIDNQCATICHKGFENDKTVRKSATSFSSPPGRKQFNPNEIIFFENVKSKCLIQFDQSYARAKVKSKNSKSVSGSSSLGNTNSGVSSLSSMTASSGSISATNPNDNKKICVESSRHILTHNGLVIQHPTLRIVPIPMESPMDIIEGQALSFLEFYLKLDSKNPTSNAQYFDLVLKKYKWSASATLLYPDIYPGILTGSTTVLVQSIHHHQNMQYPNLTTNAYFRFVFNNLKITKWGYRYILKISLRSNPACYTIETTFGPFNVRARATTTPKTKSGSSENSSNSNELRYIWTTSKCHSVKMDLQVSVIPERGGFQMFDPSTSTTAIVPSIPTSRFIDYLCDLNIEKLSTFLINFLANRASASNGDLLPAQLRLPSLESTGTKTKLKKQFTVKRDFSFTNENDYTKFVTNFVQNNRLSINGSQCLEMSLQSNNFSLIETTSSTNHSSIISDMFQMYYQAFKSHHKQQLNRRLINMTFIYSSELLLKIKQVYLDDEPLYKTPPSPTNPPNKHVKTVKIESNPPHSSKTSIPESNNRNVGKRKTGVSLPPPFEEKEEEDDNDDENENVLTRATQSPQSIDRSRKITANKKPELVLPKNSDITGGRLNSRTKVVQSKSVTTTPKTMPKIVFKKGKTKTIQSSSDGEEGETSTTAPERNFLAGRPFLWIAILFANTLLVFGFIILFAICYYKKTIADDKTVTTNTNGRKPLKRLVQSGEKNGPPGDSFLDANSLKDEIFMLEKTGYSSGNSTYADSSNLDIHRLRQEQFQHNAAGPGALGDHDNVLGMKVSAQKVQNINRMIRRVPTEGESVVQVPIKAGELKEKGKEDEATDLNYELSSFSEKSARLNSPLVKISIDEVEDSQDSGNEDEEAEDAEEDPAIETSLPIIVEEDADEATKHTSWLPLPGSLPPEVSSQTNSPKASLRSAPVSFLHPNATIAHEVIEEEDEEGTGSPDLNYNLRGDMDDERKYYIYKVNNVNMIPKKECLGKVVVPPGSISTKVKASAGVTLEELRLMIRNSNDEMLQDAAKQRFRYLSESYHLVALDEAFTPVDQLYPDSGVFIKLENEHPFSKPRVDTSLTARLQAEYERRFGSLTPRRPRKFSLKKTKWDMLSEGDSRDQESKSIYDDPLPFNCQSIKEQFERQQKGGSRTQRKSLSNFRYDSMNYVDGQYRDAQAKEGDAWNPRVHQAWGPNSRGSKVQRQRFGRGQRPPWKF